MERTLDIRRDVAALDEIHAVQHKARGDHEGVRAERQRITNPAHHTAGQL